MTPAEFDRVKEALSEALRLPADARGPFVDRTLGRDSLLAREARSLLEAHEEASGGRFLEEPAFAAAELERDPDRSPGVAAGRRIGPYQVVEELGEGGMGLVVKAVRADDTYRKAVAIKLVPASRLSSRARLRFVEERQILAGLDHPNITRLLDGGTTEEGLPYLVMELVEGERIDRFCDRRGLDVEARLRLFLPVASAVSHAHRNLIVHRDLKPANILVTAEGVPKLLDFGIARLLEPGDETLTAARALTPEYASPEQLRGEPPGTASDVFSLGVVLYELLTGHRPARASGGSAGAGTPLERDAEPPSAAVTRAATRDGHGRPVPADPVALGRARGATPRALRRRLRGDLDNILLAALRREPAARYGSVEAFADDVVRHLDGRPVRARPPTRRYRAGKFVRRNPALVAAIAAAALLLGAGVIGTAWQARRAEAQRALAERRFEQVRALANAFLFEVHDAVAPLPGSTGARELLVRRGLEYLDLLARQAADRSLRLELARGYQRVGDVQGGSFMSNLGDLPGALASYGKAIALAEAGSGDPEAQRVLAAALRARSSVEALSGDPGGARQDAERALAIARGLPAGSAAGRVELARALTAVGFAAFHGGDLGASRPALEEAVRLLEAAHGEAPADAEVSGLLASGHWSLAGTLWTAGDLAAAAGHYREAAALQEALLAADPRGARTRRQLAFTVEALGALQGQRGEPALAVALLERSVALRRELAVDDPKDADARVNALAAEKNLAVALAGAGRLAEAARLADRILPGAEAELAREPATRQLRALIAEVHGARSLVHRLGAAEAGPAGRRHAARAERDELLRARSAWRALEAEGALNAFERQTLAGVEDRLASPDLP